MHKKYDHKAIERKWQEKWKADGLYDVGERDSKKDKEYVLVEWPYPSGNLHIGHWYAFAVPDIYARFRRMTGKQVLYPMGFDAFGLPAENAAIKHNTDPKAWTDSNIEYMRSQLSSMGNSFSWDKTCSSTDPEYYKWTQWMFTEFFKNDIAYRGEGTVNWCPGCNTVIANEQVQADDTCERCDSEIEKKKMPQWMLRITDFADDLVDDLDDLNWPEFIKESQRNWIGRSEGAEVEFQLNTATKNDYVFLHAYKDSSEGAFWQNLKDKVEATGAKVYLPDLPNPAEPNIDEQIEFLLENYEFSENTIMVTHSLGGVLALKLLPKLKSKISKLIMVAPPSRVEFIDGVERPAIIDCCDWKFDFDGVKEKVNQVTVLADKKDHILTVDNVKANADALNADFVLVTGNSPHFDGKSEPEVEQQVLPKVKVFTTRPDTLFGATYMVFAPEHDLVAKNKTEIGNWDEVEKYINEAKKKAEQDRLDATKEKTGVKLEGITATNPANGEEIPVFIADYVLAGYGTGAIMAVPAHDERDHEFAKKYGVQITYVVKPTGDILKIQTTENKETKDIIFTGRGELISSGEFDGMSSEEAKEAITKKVGGKMTSTYRLRDWSIGRQRYWGVPIPIVYDPEGKAHPVPAKHLPWLLPEDVDFRPTGEPPLAKSKELEKRTEEIFGAGWTPEVETMDTFVDSSWYFLRYLDNKNDKELASKARQQDWMPIDIYFGGAEHTTMHLLYSRFWMKALHKLGLVEQNEPYTRRINRGLIMGPDGNKMSKSKGNVVDPDEQVNLVGADTVKMYLAFMGPYAEVNNYPFDLGGIAGIRRFLERVYGLDEHFVEEDSEETLALLHKTIKKVRADIVDFKFNTAISAMMVFINHVEKEGLEKSSYATLLKLLSPFAPFLTEELWSKYHDSSIHSEEYPDFDEELAKDDMVTIGVQINGKLRGDITVAPDADEITAVEATKNNENLTSRLEGKTIVKTIYVPGRILNFILKNK